MSNYTWEHVDLTKGSKIIKCKWVFRMKYHSNVNTCMSRLMTKDFKQKEDVYYFDTYAIVKSTMKIIVSFVLT